MSKPESQTAKVRSAKANLMDAQARFSFAIHQRDFLFDLPHWDQRRRDGIDRATEEVDKASRSLDAWKRALSFAEGASS
jgi:hypothetical protein